MRDDIGVSVKRLLDLTCNLTGQGQRGRETRLCVTPQSQISSDVISSQSRSFQRHLPPLPPSLLPPTHRPHPPASSVSSPLPSLHPFPLTVFTPKNRKFTITSYNFSVSLKSNFCSHDMRDDIVCVTSHSQTSSDGISSQSRSYQRYPPPSSLLPPTHRFHPIASLFPSPFPSLCLFTPKRRKFTNSSYNCFGSVTSNLCFYRAAGRGDLRDDISVSAERLLDLNCNLEGQTHGDEEGGREGVTTSYVTVRFPVTSFLSESCLREQVVSKTAPLSTKQPNPLPRLSTPVTLLSSPAILHTSISRPLLHLFVQHREASRSDSV